MPILVKDLSNKNNRIQDTKLNGVFTLYDTKYNNESGNICEL